MIGTGAGVGLLVWGLLIYHHENEIPFGSPAGIIGTGAGFLAGSVVLFVAALRPVLPPPTIAAVIGHETPLESRKRRVRELSRNSTDT